MSVKQKFKRYGNNNSHQFQELLQQNPEDFIEYWDKVVRQWLDNNANHKSFTNDAQEQHQIIEAINSSVGKNSKYWLNTDHMPEPYWGNPKECSIVLLDYNPAGGSQPSRHTSISCKNCTNMGESFIHYVNTHSYSEFALNGPVFIDKNCLTKQGCDWFTSYGGYGWWQEKRKWLDHLVEAKLKNKEDKLPFGMELCGWHSENWSNDMSWINNGCRNIVDENGCRNIVDERAIQPLFESLKCSSAQMAVCIGAEFKFDWLKQFFNNKIKDVTEAASKEVKKNVELKKSHNIVDEDGKVIFSDLTYTVEYDKKENIHVYAEWNVIKKKGKVPAAPANRNYRVSKITEGNESYYILNTNYRGGNGHPAKHFWRFEEYLIDAIQKL